MIVHVYGLGFVGLTTSLALANKNIKVIGYDTDEIRIKKLKEKKIPFFEKNLDNILKKQLNKNFKLNEKKTNQSIDINFVCVGTLDKKNEIANIKSLKKCVNSIIKEKNKFQQKIIIIRSSTPPLTTEKLILPLIKKSKKNIEIAYFPEFLAEGKAWNDFHNAQRLVIGIQKKETKSVFLKLFKKFKFKISFTNLRTSEFIKYLTNSFLSTMISFSNEYRDIAVALKNINIKEAFKIFQTDPRWFSRDNNFNYYTFPGCGYGGSCLPKDINSIIETSINYGKYEPKILKQVTRYNKDIFSKIGNGIIKDIKNKSDLIGILGLSFKPNTDDVRGSPSEKIIKHLKMNGYNNIVAHDPKAVENFSSFYPNLKIKYESNLDKLINKSKKLILITTWDIYKKKINKKIINKTIDLRYCL